MPASFFWVWIGRKRGKTETQQNEFGGRSHCAAVERPHWLRWSPACYFQIAGGAPALPTGPPRWPDQKDILFEKRSTYEEPALQNRSG